MVCRSPRDFHYISQVCSTIHCSNYCISWIIANWRDGALCMLMCVAPGGKYVTQIKEYGVSRRVGV